MKWTPVLRSSYFVGCLLLVSCSSLPWRNSAELSIRLTEAPTRAEVVAVNKALPPEKVLIGGTPIDRKKYPDVVRITNGSGYCTASIVGPRALLSAAHCMKDGQLVTFSTVLGDRYSARCTHHPEYKTADHDIALCHIDREVSGVTPREVVYERSARRNQKVQLFGYGCIKPGGGGGNDGILRTGHSNIVAGQGRDLVLESPGGAALCFGDSGGPVHTMEGRQIAVNSKGNIKDRSWVSRTERWTANFYEAWCKSTGASIAGVPGSCGGGGQGDDPPGGPKPETLENENYRIEIYKK